MIWTNRNVSVGIPLTAGHVNKIAHQLNQKRNVNDFLIKNIPESISQAAVAQVCELAK